MRKFMLLVILFASACNLNNQPATPTQPPEATEAEITPEIPPTSLPAINATAALTPNATRTPFGTMGDNAAPTTQSIAPTSAFPTPATGESVEFTSPAGGATVSGTPLYVSGIVRNLPQNQFVMQVFGADEQPVTSPQTITLSNPNNVADVPWSASVQVNTYTGPATVHITAKTAPGTDAVIGTLALNIAAGNASIPPNPNSSGSSITSPANGSNITSDPITVTGTAGGIPENQFTLMLLNPSGTVLNSQVITLSGAETASVPWSASLGRSGYRGQAEIRAVRINNGQQETIASVTVNLQ